MCRHSELAMSESWGISLLGKEGSSEHRRFQKGAPGRWCVPWVEHGLQDQSCWDEALVQPSGVNDGGRSLLGYKMLS